MLTKKLFRTIWLYKAQFISMIVMVALGIGIFVGFNSEWYTIKTNTFDFYEKSGLSDYQIILENGFTKDDAQKISQIDGVDESSRVLVSKVDVKGRKGNTLSLNVVENINVSGFVLTSGEEYDSESENGLWLSDKYAEKSDIEIGDSLTFTFNGIDVEGKVAGLIKSSEYTVCMGDKSQIIPDLAKHAFVYISPKMYEKVTFGNGIYPQINIISDLEKDDFVEKVNDTLGRTTMVLTKNENPSYAGPVGEIEEGQTMGAFLPCIFLAIAILTMVTTMHRLSVKEKLQIGTLKAMGLKDRKILLHYTAYSLTVGVFGTVFGFLIGLLISYVLMDPNGAFMAVYIDMPTWTLRIPPFAYVVVLLINVGLALVGFLSVKNILRGTPADALRPYTPKKVKPMLIEKTKFFHKLSFATRWNLRDTVRHKARSLMSIFGTCGCVLIILASLGMRDTVDLMYERNYEGAINYNSRIYTDSVDELEEKYKGDASGSISVQLDDEAVSLDIYRLGNDKVRFIDTDMEYMELQDDGVYICKRIAKERNLKIGDVFVVKPFGTDVEYSLKVGGIMSSFAKSIALTEDYAKEVGIQYKLDSIYTDVDSEDIEPSEKITTVQTKESLISAFDTMIQIMDSMIAILLVVGIVLGVIVLYNLGVMSYTERYRELATLKVVGFKDKRIANILIGQNMAITFVGAIIGIPLSHLVLTVLMDQLAPEYELKVYISVLSHFLALLIAFLVSLFVGFMLSRKNKHIDMVEALKNGD